MRCGVCGVTAVRSDTSPLYAIYCAILHRCCTDACSNSCCSMAVSHFITSCYAISCQHDTNNIYDLFVSSVGITRLMRAISNQEFMSFERDPARLLLTVNYGFVNAFYDGFGVTLGEGLAVADVVAHEWVSGHGGYIHTHRATKETCTHNSTGIRYLFQPINAVLFDVCLCW